MDLFSEEGRIRYKNSSIKTIKSFFKKKRGLYLVSKFLNNLGTGNKICSLESKEDNLYIKSSPNHLDYSDGKFLDYPISDLSDFESYFGTTNRIIYFFMNDCKFLRFTFNQKKNFNFLPEIDKDAIIIRFIDDNIYMKGAILILTTIDFDMLVDNDGINLSDKLINIAAIKKD